MTPEELQAAEQAGTPTQTQKVASDALQFAADSLDSIRSPGDLYAVVSQGVWPAVSSAVDAATAVVGLAVDGAGEVLTGAADVASEAAGAVVEVVAGLLN